MEFFDGVLVSATETSNPSGDKTWVLNIERGDKKKTVRTKTSPEELKIEVGKSYTFQYRVSEYQHPKFGASKSNWLNEVREVDANFKGSAPLPNVKNEQLDRIESKIDSLAMLIETLGESLSPKVEVKDPFENPATE